MASAKPLLYVILGAAGSGRREVVADLLANGLAEEDRGAVLLSADEPADPADERLGVTTRWTWSPGDAEMPASMAAVVPEGATHVFVITDGRRNPVDQIEALKAWLGGGAAVELARVLTVVNCQLVEKHPELLAWYDACVHFSDVVLLNRREGVGNKWLSDFQNHYKSQFLPSLFELVKGSRVKNPLVVLLPEARRMSHLFDEDLWAGLEGVIVETGVDDDEEPTHVGDETDDEDDELKPEVDVYLARRLGGRREKEIPDIAKFV